MKKNIKEFFEDSRSWKKEYSLLRDLILDTQLTEEFKWGKPCYTLNGSNIVLMHGFKDYCALLFHKGALLKDPKDILVQQTENVQSARQLRFKSAKEIEAQATTIKAYIFEATEVEKAGLEVKMKKTADYAVPEELTQAFEEDSEFKRAFHNLTPGRQRGYLLHFSAAKQSKTREARIEKYRGKIFEGKGFQDRD